MRKVSKILAVAIFSIFLMVGTAMATSVSIDFSDGSLVGGTITSDGTNAQGTGIAIGVMDVTIDGVETVYTLNPGNAFLSFDTLTGTININGTINVGGTIVTGDLLSGEITDYHLVVSNYYLSLSDAVGPDTKLAALLEALGIDPDTKFEYFGFSIAGDVNYDSKTQTWTGTAKSTDIYNHSVPEPASMLLLGLGLFGIGIVSRKKS